MNFLFPLSASRRSGGPATELIRSASPAQAQPASSADATFPRTPDPSRHSAVCCCLLCEQRGTGEQAMRSVGGDYARFLARVALPLPHTDAPAGDRPNPTRKPSRYGAFPMRRRESARVLGPYLQDHQWRVIQIDSRGRRKSHIVDSKQAAQRLMARLQATLEARTVESTLELWVAARLRGGDATPSTIADQAARARTLLGPALQLRLDEVTERKATALYERAATEPSLKTGQPLRAATHRFYLSIVQYLWKWAQKQGYAKDNPWAEVEPIGRVSAGKPQLRPAEARRFAAVAEEEAAAGSGLALAALSCLSLGLRASESLGLTARDIDVAAGEVYVSGTKTAAARRRLKLPANLAILLGRAASARHPMERLCVAPRQSLHSKVVALCARAGVPRVCVHGLRGTHASLAVSGGASVEAVARVLGHTSTKMTLGHYVTEQAAADARVAAVEASLSLPNHSAPPSEQKSPTGDPLQHSLLSLSTPLQGIGSQAPTVSTASRTPDPRRHSAVCCCRLCEQRGTGEQAMRSVGGDYQRFLARLAGR